MTAAALDLPVAPEAPMTARLLAAATVILSRIAPTNGLGEPLVAVHRCGTTWIAEYAPVHVTPVCCLCDQKVTVWKSSGNMMARAVARLPDGSFGWAHIGCIVKTLGRRTFVQGAKDKAPAEEAAA